MAKIFRKKSTAKKAVKRMKGSQAMWKTKKGYKVKTRRK